MDITVPAATAPCLRRFSCAQKIVLAAILVALQPGSPTAGSSLVRRLVYSWIAQNVVLVVRNCDGRPLGAQDFDTRRQGM